MESRILTVNGIESDGSGSTDLLGATLAARGFKWIDVNQPIRNAWQARWKAQKDAKDIIRQARDGDYLICHSYGGRKSGIAMRGVKFKAVFMFRPAMSRWHKFPMYQDTKIFCVYSKQDYTILMGSLALFHPFGLAGFSGFKSPFVKNIKSQGAHSDDFKPGAIEHWADFVENSITLIERNV